MNLKHYVWDCETFPNCFTFGITRSDGKHAKVFEISEFQNDILGLFKCIDYLVDNNISLIGFNNLGFDYPVLHAIINARKRFIGCTGLELAEEIYSIAMQQIASARDGFASTIPENEIIIKQIDLFKINHFDNKAKMTSLKQIEFNMRMNNLQELPFPVGTRLTREEIIVLKKYNMHDVEATRLFYLENVGAIQMREDLTKKYGFDCTNFNDTKIGKKYFENTLNQSGVATHTQQGKVRKMKQTKRPWIDIKDCLFDYYNFTRPEFIAVKNWFASRRISETKGVFSDIPEHKLGDVAKYAEMVTKQINFKGKPSQKEIDDFLNEYPKGWIEEVELSAMEVVKDEEGNPIKEEYVDDKGKVKKRNVKRHKIAYKGKYRIAETLNVVVNGLRLDFGVGGIHGSVSGVVKADNKWMIVDADV